MRTLAVAVVETGVGPDVLLAHPALLEEIVDVLNEKAKARGR